MSSCDCSTLEGFIKDSLFGHYSLLHVLLVAHQMDSVDPSVRDTLEYKINHDFDEEVQNWRDYRSSLAYLFDPINTYVDELVKITKLVPLAAMLLYSENHLEVTTKVNSQELSDRLAAFLVHFTDNDITYSDFMPILKAWWESNVTSVKDIPMSYK